jgi:hypothetical protein
MPTKKSSRPTIDEVIAKTIIATRRDCLQTPKDVYSATERRLYAYPVIKAKIKNDMELLERYLGGERPSKSSWFIRFQKSGIRLSDEEILDALIEDMRAKIAADECEIETIDKALEFIGDDRYVKVIPCLYFEGKTISQTCDEVPCDRSTVFRQKSRLVRRLATFLYGACAAM